MAASRRTTKARLRRWSGLSGPACAKAPGASSVDSRVAPAIPARKPRRLGLLRCGVIGMLLSLDADAHGVARNPGRTHLDRGHSFCGIRGHPKINLIAIHLAGEADCSRYVGRIP